MTIQNLKVDLTNPLTLHKIICNRLPNIKLVAFPTQKINGIKLHFQEEQDKDRFLNIFKDKDFGPLVKINSYKETRQEAQKIHTRTTFTCVIRGIPIETKIEDLKEYQQKEKTLPITKATRIRNQ